jgi:hypothetical protein
LLIIIFQRTITLKKTQQHQQYKYEEFDQHISLWATIPSGQGHSLVLLRKIVEGIQSGSFTRNPSIVIAGEGSRELAIATANTLCSSDIREIDAKFLFNTKNMVDFFSSSNFDSVHIILNIGSIGLSESVLWNFIKSREYKFSRMDGSWEIIHSHGSIILTSEQVKSISPRILKIADFKVIMEPWTQSQLELLVHQRLKFCGIDYGDNEEVLKTIIEYCQGEIWRIIDLLKICVLLAQSENQKLTLRMVEKASKMTLPG